MLDFLDCYFDRHKFELIQMEKDSNYIAISFAQSCEAEFEATK